MRGPVPCLLKVESKKPEVPAAPDQVEDEGADPATPPRGRKRRRGGRGTPRKTTPEAKKEKRADPPTVVKDKRNPESERTLITAASGKVSGPKRCHYYNSSMGCAMAEKCRFKHLCMICGSAHPMVGNHRGRPASSAGADDGRASGQTAPAPWWGSGQVPAAPGFLEIFAGKAGLTQAAKRHGVAVLPPIELLPNEVVLEAVDILQPEVLQHVKALLTGHHVQMVHFGTPCSSFSQARKLDGGPPPLRDRDHLYGLAGLAADDQTALRLGAQLMEVTAQLVTLAQQAGVQWSIENPETSLLWDMPPVQTLASFPTVQKFGLDMCRFGSPHMKPTTLLANYDLAAVALRCDRAQRPHEHEPLIGKVQVDGRWVYKTRLAQVYPPALCQQWAAVLDRSRPDPLAATFAMVTPDRKRPLGQAMPWRPHRQHATAEKAQAAGYQLKRSAMPPLLGEEMEPGRAVQVALGLDHPFTVDPALQPDLQEALALTFFHAEAITSMREAQLEFWAQRAAILLPETDTTLRRVADPALRRLLRGVPDDQPLELGKVTHIALWRELLREARCIDRQLADEMLHGFSIIGPISRSFRWQALTSQPQLTETELHERAWEFSEKVMRNVQRSEITEFSGKVWEATMEDVQEKITVGPFYHMSEVSQYL